MVGLLSLVICQVDVAPSMSKRILILMSDTGGGHRASAEAIAEAIGQFAQQLAGLAGDKGGGDEGGPGGPSGGYPVGEVPDTSEVGVCVCSAEG